MVILTGDFWKECASGSSKKVDTTMGKIIFSHSCFTYKGKI